MNIIKEVLAYAPTNLTKIQTAQWIRAKYSFDWDKCHYHALQCVIARIELRIKEQFQNLLNVEPDEDAMKNLFSQSLSAEFDYVHQLVYVEKSKESFTEILNQNLFVSS